MKLGVGFSIQVLVTQLCCFMPCGSISAVFWGFVVAVLYNVFFLWGFFDTVVLMWFFLPKWVKSGFFLVFCLKCVLIWRVKTLLLDRLVL